MTRDEANRIELTLWRRVQQLVRPGHLEEFARLYDALAVLEDDRRADEFARGLDRGMAVERLSVLSTFGVPTPDGEWQEATKH